MIEIGSPLQDERSSKLSGGSTRVRPHPCRFNKIDLRTVGAYGHTSGDKPEASAPDVRQTRRRQKTMESIETIEVEGIACFVSSGRQLFSADKLVGNTPMYCTDLSDKTPLVSSPHHHRRWIDVSINSNSCCQTLMSTNCFHFSNHICGFRGSATPQGTSKQPSAKRVSLHFEKKPEVF